MFKIVHIGETEIISKGTPLPDLVRDHAILLDIGGHGYSGRLKYLLFSGRPLLMVDRIYIEYFHWSLIPYEHYVPVHTDLSNLMEQAIWLQRNPEKGRAIGQNAQKWAIENFTDEKLVQRAGKVAMTIIHGSETAFDLPTVVAA